MSESMKRSIRNKLVTMAVVVALIAIILLGLVSLNGLRDMKESSYAMSTELVAVSSAFTEEIIEAQALLDLEHLAEGTAQIIDAKVQTLMHELELSDIGSVIMEVNMGDYGAAFVVDEDGNVIIRTHLDENGGVVTGKENIFTSERPEIQEMVKKISLGESGIFTSPYEGFEMYWAYEPVESMPWTVVALFSESEVLGPVMLAKEQTNALAIEAQKEADNIARASTVALLAGMAASAVLAMLVGVLYSNKIAQPIRKLEAGVRRISKGQFDEQIEINTGDEIENLATAFNNMTKDLKEHIAELTTVTAEKEKIGAELNVAAQMQVSMLPNKFPAFPEYNQFDLHASMVPAKEVGGDFYDYFMIDDKNLAMVIGDVSGKGVPAALFMVNAKTMIQNWTQKNISVKEILENVNVHLCHNNDAGMFVTAWIAILDVETGELSYGNAGHNLPLLRKADGKFQPLKSDSNFVLAGIDGMEFTQEKTRLEPGDTLYLYTDGVTEATNKSNEFYTEENLEKSLNSLGECTAQKMLEHVKIDVNSFVDGADQFDDITMLGLIYKG